MNTRVDTPRLDDSPLAAQITAACARVAPTWPLDQSIAVNPYWGWVDRPISHVAAELGTLAGSPLTLPRAWFRAQWAAGTLRREHLAMAAQRDALTGTVSGTRPPDTEDTVNKLVAALQTDNAPVHRLSLVTDLRDRGTAPRPGLSWTALVTHQVSQHCAAFFDRGQATWTMNVAQGLYGTWRQQLVADHDLPWRQGRAAFLRQLGDLPTTPRAAIGFALDGMAIPEKGREAYLTAVLLAIGGWGAWCAYLRWQARLGGRDDDQIEQLLAIRLAWEWLLHGDAESGDVPFGWVDQWANAQDAARRLQDVQRTDWLLQHAVEIAYQQPLADGLIQAAPMPGPSPTRAAVQAVFCIDVRSEVFRRALESVNPGIETRAFAGFFGLPIEYSPLGSVLVRPQVPGLLAPAQRVTESADEPHLATVLTKRRRQALQWRQRWANLRMSPASGFSFVESLGLLYGGKLLSQSLPSSAVPARWEDTGLPVKSTAALRPRLPQAATDPAATAAMLHGILTAMGLVDGFAPLVLIAGHGSQSANNPQAAGLNCGACGGQSGDVNARALADALNLASVRKCLRERGISIPDDTHFVPALHNTTTDEMTLYDTEAVPQALSARMDELRRWLAVAGEHSRAERASSLGLAALSPQPEALLQSLRQRGNDWSQVRPEWGLVNNAAFIVAPRARTRHMNLAGRSFLHDYDYRLDPDLKILTLLMTAPMLVTNWINMQYHASTVDNLRFGSGNKLLHNVVGGDIGVFEGNGGDLRIGLALQSLHDGQVLRHNPLRLSVFIEAPRSAIDRVMAENAIVQQVAGNGWLHLFCIDPQDNAIAQHWRGGWTTIARENAKAA